MNIFISYKFTGEIFEDLLDNIGSIEKQLVLKGNNVYSSLQDEEWFKKNKSTNKDILIHTIKKLNESDIVLVFLNSNEKSEGMLMEIGYAMAKNKKIILLIKNGIETNYLRDIAYKVFEFNNIQDIKDGKVIIEI